tara:strand:+ start:596 stop:775 length:180 start_codon:yes stop_codon:yes gene_type:complete
MPSLKQLAKFALFRETKKYKIPANKFKPIKKLFVGGGPDGGVVKLLKWEQECRLPPFLL